MPDNWGRFNDYIGQTWDYVVEAGMGDPTDEESSAILDLGYWGEEISKETIAGLRSGEAFSAPAFRFRVHAEDGVHEHRHPTKEALIASAKEYGPPQVRQGTNSWVEEFGRTIEVEGATFEEIWPDWRE
jgi:hypothetical protein